MQQYKTDTKIATDFTKKQRASHQRNSTKETTMKEKGRGGGGGADVGILSGECLTLTAPRSSPCLSLVRHYVCGCGLDRSSRVGSGVGGKKN